MERTILIKGTGRVSTAPDQIVIPFTLTAENKKYEKAMSLADTQLAQIQEALTQVGFAKEEIKTVRYAVDPVYKDEEDEKGHYRAVLSGYACRHEMKLTFDLDTDRLSEVLSALAACPAKPEFQVRFTVKNPDALYAQLLTDAAENARAKAEVLCKASGVQLGTLLQIFYNWEDVNLYSSAAFDLAVIEAPMPKMNRLAVTPEDIDTQANVAFIWQIC